MMKQVEEADRRRTFLGLATVVLICFASSLPAYADRLTVTPTPGQERVTMTEFNIAGLTDVAIPIFLFSLTNHSEQTINLLGGAGVSFSYLSGDPSDSLAGLRTFFLSPCVVSLLPGDTCRLSFTFLRQPNMSPEPPETDYDSGTQRMTVSLGDANGLLGKGSVIVTVIDPVPEPSP